MAGSQARRGPDNTLDVTLELLAQSCIAAGFSKQETERLLKESKGNSCGSEARSSPCRAAADTKSLLKKNTEKALELGAFGSPTMIVHGGDPTPVPYYSPA